MPGTPDVQAVVTAERRLLEPSVRTDRAAIDRLLHPEFTEIGASGRLWTRAEILDAMPTWEPTADLVVSDLVADALDPDTVLLTYVCSSATRRTRRSSIWRRDGERWRVRFHQGTPLDGPRE